MYKTIKILVIYFMSFFISSSIFFNSFCEVVSLNEEEVLFKKVNNFYVPVKTVPVETVTVDSASVKTGFMEKDKELRDHDLVIFIHGTVLPFPSPSTIIQTLKGNKKSPIKNKSFFYKYMNNIRYKSIFKYQPINDTGLRKINIFEKNSTTVQEKSCKKIAGCYNTYCHRQDSVKTRSYYTFGWSGHLNQGRRYGWADSLYKELIKEVKKVKKSENRNINIVILAHSHGGNVALRLVDIEKKYKKGLRVKRLVLLGTPVQKETSQAIYSDLFDKIYNVYSRGDPIQVIDCISTKSAYSKRKFRSLNDDGLPQKLVQIEVLCGKLKPMHNELWFLREKWNLFYRKRLSVYPNPISVFIPEIMKVVDDNFSDGINLQLNIEKEKDKFKLSFKNLNESDSIYKYFADFPHS